MDKHRFGGAWTVEKLDILEKYLNAYSIALMNQKFDKLYIDAFAGNGTVECKIDDHNTLEIDGSAKLALKMLILVNSDHRSYNIRPGIPEISGHRSCSIRPPLSYDSANSRHLMSEV